MLCEIITENETKKIYVDGLLLIPVGEFFNKSKVILEISGFTMHEVGNLRVKKLDYEYFSIVISTILKGILSKFTKESIIIQERK